MLARSRSPLRCACPPTGRRAGLRLLLVLVWLSGCVPVPPDVDLGLPPPSRSTTITQDVFQGLDPGAKEVIGVHFRVRAYGTDRADAILQWAENQYNKIMVDTGLYSFKPSGLYSIVIYANRDEYLKKTGQPDWSGGLTAHNAIYSFDDAQLNVIMAHEMTHLIFNEYMGLFRIDLKWINEGLAVYEESQHGRLLGLTGLPQPFDQMVIFAPANERDRDVSQWYAQVGMVVRFMIEQGGHNGFAQFLAALKNNKNLDDALREGFVGKWTNMAQLEADWKAGL